MCMCVCVCVCVRARTCDQVMRLCEGVCVVGYGIGEA